MVTVTKNQFVYCSFHQLAAIMQPSVEASCSTGLKKPLFTDFEEARELVMSEANREFRKWIFMDLTEQGQDSTLADFSLRGLLELFTLLLMTEKPLAVMGKHIDKAFRSAIVMEDCYSAFMWNIVISSSAPSAFRIKYIPRTRGPVEQGSIYRFLEMHSRYFPSSDIWLHR